MNRGLIMFLVAAAMLLAFVAGTRMASAGNWTLFERVCLEPLEDFRVPLRDHLQLQPAAREDAGVYGADGGDVLRPLEGAGVVVLRGPAECLVITPLNRTTGSDRTLRDGWLASNLKNGRYRIVEQGAHSVVLHSSTWREPRLAVAIWTDALDRVAVLSAIETNFEA